MKPLPLLLTSLFYIAGCTHTYESNPHLQHEHVEASKKEIQTQVSYMPNYLSKADQYYYEQTLSRAYIVDILTKLSWNNTKTNRYGSITVLNEKYSKEGFYCRELMTTFSNNSRTDEFTFTSCQNIHGIWTISD